MTRCDGPGGTIHAVTPDGACTTIAARTDDYNNHRPHSATGYVTPHDKILSLETFLLMGGARPRSLIPDRGLSRFD